MNKDEIRERRRALHRKAMAPGGIRLTEIREIRHALGLSQPEFAKHFKLTVRQLSEIENGKANPTKETLDKIGRLMGFELAYVATIDQFE